MILADLLRGYRANPHNTQSVGNMAIMPLTSAVEFKSPVGEVDDVVVVSNQRMVVGFENRGKGVGIVMQGFMPTFGKMISDVAVPRGHIIPPGETARIGVFSTSFPNKCNSRQDVKERPSGLLPPTLRTTAILRSNAMFTPQSYGLMQPDVAAYVQPIGNNHDIASLDDLYQSMTDTLDGFIAQFELVTDQLGVISIINGEVVAIDIMPSYRSWNLMWRSLLRNSYGMDAARAALMGMDRRFEIDFSNTTLIAAKQRWEAKVRRSWDLISTEKVTLAPMVDVDSVRLLGVTSPGYWGQAVFQSEDDRLLYMSLVPRKTETERINQFVRHQRSLKQSNYLTMLRG